MRRVALMLAVFGLLTAGAVSALAQEPIISSAPGAVVTGVTDQAVVTPVRRYVYYGDPGWSTYPYAGGYYTYRPAYPWRSYYYPGYYPSYYPGYRYYAAPGFYYSGPRIRIGVGF